MLANKEGFEYEIPSTFERELAFSAHHAIHHLAMVKVISDALGVDVDENFGKAPSTIVHEESVLYERGKGFDEEAEEKLKAGKSRD
jgi:hypothetical protein